MDPNSTVRDIAATDAALERGEITPAQHRAQINAYRRALRAWRRIEGSDGFPPAIGWARALSL